jgi:hypothetical protein
MVVALAVRGEVAAVSWGLVSIALRRCKSPATLTGLPLLSSSEILFGERCGTCGQVQTLRARPT